MSKPDTNTIASADIYRKYAARATRDSLRKHLAHKSAPKAVATYPYGNGKMSFYDEAAIDAYLDRVLPKPQPTKPAAAPTPAPAQATLPACASGAELRYLVGMHEETQKVVEALLKGQQLMFKQVEGIANQVNALAKLWESTKETS